MMKYYSEEGKAKVQARRPLWSPELQERVSKEWAGLFHDVEAALDQDPAGETAQALVERWNKLLEGFTGVTMQHLTDKGQLSSDAVIGLSKFIMQTRGERTKEAVALQQKLQETNEQTEFAKRQLAEKSVGIARTERVAIRIPSLKTPNT